MQSIVSYPVRGNYGRNDYRGNCSGLLIKDIISQFQLKGLSDFMVGSGTTEQVVREAGLRGDFADLNRGYDMLSMDIPNRAENLFFHPPYHDIIVYSNKMYNAKSVENATGLSAETILADDLSRCKSWEDFIGKLNACMMKQFAALEKGGRMFTLMGDVKRHGVLYSMLLDIAKPGTLEQVIIKTQHNTWSERQSYSGRFVPIVHEYLLVTRKDDTLVFPVSWGVSRRMDSREVDQQSWRDLLASVLDSHRDGASLEELYAAVEGSSKAKANPHWKEKVRQTLQNIKTFTRTARGCYALAPAVA